MSTQDPGVISNLADLAAKGMVEPRALALSVAAAGLAACDVRRATAEAVELTGRGVSIAGREYPLAPSARVVVVGSGKATLAIASALEQVLGDRIDGGAIAVRDGAENGALDRIEVLPADHPLPSERSVEAARRMLELVAGLDEGDLVLAAFTGGSSALTSLPPAGITHEEKRTLHELLLASGAPISEVNAVRKHVSAFKGGRFAASVAPARLVNLAVSDVAGDVLDTLTDPSVQDTSTVDGALEILHRHGLWDRLPASIRAHLGSDAAHSPRLESEPHTVLLVTGAAACEAMAAAANAAGAAAHVVSTELEGEATWIGRHLAELATSCARNGRPLGAPCVLVGCGGEATVTLAGGPSESFGAGGPNQEAAAVAALHLAADLPVAACFIDTDGSDGGSDAAGAVVDGLTGERAQVAGVDLAAAVSEHRTGAAFAGLGDLIVTGPTQTNVNDLFVVAVGSPHT